MNRYYNQQQQHQTGDIQPGAITLDFASQRWLNQIRVSRKGQTVYDRRMLEVCVFSHVADLLRSGDLYIAGSEEYADYRAQLLPWAECQKRLAAYCEALTLPPTAAEFVQQLRQQLRELAWRVDADFPQKSESNFISVPAVYSGRI